jgi:RNA polymerase subunit RPABC4/transcription elongation factor Spt4
MKFCKTCDKKLPKDEKLNQCQVCISNKEGENFE